jgi:hypothetical protein
MLLYRHHRWPISINKVQRHRILLDPSGRSRSRLLLLLPELSKASGIVVELEFEQGEFRECAGEFRLVKNVIAHVQYRVPSIYALLKPAYPSL